MGYRSPNFSRMANVSPFLPTQLTGQIVWRGVRTRYTVSSPKTATLNVQLWRLSPFSRAIPGGVPLVLISFISFTIQLTRQLHTSKDGKRWKLTQSLGSQSSSHDGRLLLVTCEQQCSGRC